MCRVDVKPYALTYLVTYLRNLRVNHMMMMVLSANLACHVQIMIEDSFAEGPQDGSYINGLYLDGARWDRQR